MATTECDVAIAGAGPGGLMLGYLLARAGQRVKVLEKHGDFLRDFRGDTIHPSTLTVLGELGLRDAFLSLPVNRLPRMDVVVSGRRLSIVDFNWLRPPDDFLVMAPQWDFLDFIAAEAQRLPGFTLHMRTEATDVIEDAGRIVGMRATHDGSVLEIRAPLTIAADGRDSLLRTSAGFVPTGSGVPIDVLWFHLPKPTDPPPVTLAYVGDGGLVLTIDRGDRYQAGCVIRKGGIDRLRDAGLDAFRARLARVSPPIARVVDALESWDQIKVLSVQLNALDTWHRPGFACIGDAAHAMSPVFGVGVNYAIQDAVALANRLVKTPKEPQSETLAAFQRRRLPPVRRMQRVQRVAHRGIGHLAAGGTVPRAVPPLLTILQPVLRPVMARLVGRGFRPEHVSSALASPARQSRGSGE